MRKLIKRIGKKLINTADSVYPLMVRIAGFNTLLIQLSDIEQEEIIERAVAMERSGY